MLRRVRIDKLAPTGEGVARTSEKVGFVAGALPGEEVDAEVLEERRRFWKGRAVAIHDASPARVHDPHAGCPGCDWAHFEPAAARTAKRELFLETMERIGKIPRSAYGDLPVVASPPHYRLRNRFHVSSDRQGVRIGFFAPRSHRVEPLADCAMVGREVLALLPGLGSAIEESRVPVGQITTVEDLEGNQRLASIALGPGEPGDAESLARDLGALFTGWRVVDPVRGVLREAGPARLTVRVGSRELFADTDAFFQANRFLVGPMFEEARSLALSAGGGAALDAYGGVGLFAGALLDAGLDPVTVEQGEAAVDCARQARRRWGVGERWQIVRAPVERYLESTDGRFSASIADPPRGGLGPDVARALAARTSRSITLVSCDPPTLARDLPVLLGAGWRIASATLYDLFAFTHRIEAIVGLEPEKR